MICGAKALLFHAVPGTMRIPRQSGFESLHGPIRNAVADMFTHSPSHTLEEVPRRVASKAVLAKTAGKHMAL